MSRPASEFDAGINASTAWTEHLERGASFHQTLSDDEDSELEREHGRPARALYDFDGKPEFRELSLTAGDELTIIKELQEGWSLANCAGEVGLVPKSYYIFTAEFKSSPSTISHSRQRTITDSEDVTPRTSPRNTPPPLMPQATGDWIHFPNFRQSLLGGKSLNRFSSFVTTGAEDWVLNGSEEIPQEAFSHSRDHSRAQPDEDDNGEEEEEQDDAIARERAAFEATRHFVEAGPSWKSKLPPFRVLVHTPEKRTNALTGAYTIYHVTSLFYPERADDDHAPPAPPTRVTVHRRFSHFVFLHTALSRRLPGIALPPLPEKQYAGRFSQEFVEARRGDLERYLGRIVRHPVARYAEVVTFFLSCESEQEWRRLVPQHMNLPPAGPSFYARVFHPAFNVDADEARLAIERFDAHTHAVKKSVQHLRSSFGKFRTARAEMSVAQRLMSYSFLSLVTATPVAKASPTPDEEFEEEEDLYPVVGKKGAVNTHGAWCWRENCEECLRLTKNMQHMAEAMHDVASMHERNARDAALAAHESLKDVAHPDALYAPVMETHRAALSRYQDASSSHPDEDVAARCETVLNTTMAEFETYHAQKVEDFERLATQHLDAEIALYEGAAARLRQAREAFDYADPADDSRPREPSKIERELPEPRLRVDPPLTMPCPHVFDSAPMRPVSVAIQEGVGLLMSGAGRASVFGKFW
ncbi:hypothetical protein EXIGLDRAFT_717673 [Exidia glandulosa HHB12029]|uniref:PX-domain-containing protein n=1 Tax=Exidia glandulosa HHB12029 TaxID=1314781 RepID=A0A165I7U3_EXIGL|nr:hypothetical protein EXIGLDRAFT_717673 [Exidia glandulosa HHB12029]